MVIQPIKIIQGHVFWGQWKGNKGLIHNKIILASFPIRCQRRSIRKLGKSMLSITPLPFDAMTPPLQGTTANIRINLILAESRVTGLHRRRIVIQIFMVGSERRTCFETVHNGPSKSSKVLILAPIESVYATFYWSSIVTLVVIVQIPTIASTKDPQFFRGFQIFCGSRSAIPLRFSHLRRS